MVSDFPLEVKLSDPWFWSGYKVEDDMRGCFVFGSIPLSWASSGPGALGKTPKRRPALTVGQGPVQP